jgi:predicted RNA-binding Zn-ribbon protein involved in translation (DUF1610 family)
MEQHNETIFKKNEKKRIQEYDNATFWSMLALLLPFLIYSISLNANTIEYNTAGKAWKCENCRIYQWQDSSNKNWCGKYKCTSCGYEK